MNKHLDKFLTYLEIEKNFSGHTLVDYRIDLEEFVGFLGQALLGSAAYPDLRRFLSQLKGKDLKPRTVARKLSALRSFFKFLQRQNIIASTNFQKIIFPKMGNYDIFKL